MAEPTKQHMTLDLRWVVVALFIIIAAMLFMWRPWQSDSSNERTITVTGESTLKAAPDEYIFTPIYQFENSDKTEAIDAMTKKSEAIVAKLKELGVPESSIKTNAGGFESTTIKTDPSDSSIYTLQVTATVDNQELAQKVQNYLLTTAPTGNVTPQPTFSETKRKELQAEARDLATKDAHDKAEASARNIGFKLGAVKTVSDGSGFWAWPTEARDSVASSLAVQPTLSLTPGENELPYSIQVVYYVR